MPELRNKPLVEAILELRWAAANLPADQPFQAPDPYYRLFVGRLYDRVRGSYPHQETLPAAQIPDLMVAHVAQFRFRAAANGWPLIQTGPGLLTLNETVAYSWATFKQRALELVRFLGEAHPAPQDVRLRTVTLRYIDAILIPPNTGFFDLMRRGLKVPIEFPAPLFERHGVARAPSAFGLQGEFPSGNPPGVAGIKISLGTRDGQPALVLDTAIESKREAIPGFPDGFEAWVDAAHTVTSDWFKDLTAGDLYDSFEPVV